MSDTAVKSPINNHQSITKLDSIPGRIVKENLMRNISCDSYTTFRASQHVADVIFDLFRDTETDKLAVATLLKVTILKIPVKLTSTANFFGLLPMVYS